MIPLINVVPHLVRPGCRLGVDVSVDGTQTLSAQAVFDRTPILPSFVLPIDDFFGLIVHPVQESEGETRYKRIGLCEQLSLPDALQTIPAEAYTSILLI